MIASRSGQTGALGVREVSADFERIGWGVAPNLEHDLGTDLFLMARDQRLIDLGMIVGAQVKAGEYWFKASVTANDGAVLGWWFRESTHDHFDAWLAHQVPHIVVLHNVETRRSYWQHVTRDKVEYAAKGARIFVPESNVVDEENLGKLLDVASSGSSKIAWEGSAWTGAQISPGDKLRSALLVPRLVAPHPNRGSEGHPLSAEQTVAMLIQVRLREIEYFSEKNPGTPPLEAVNLELQWTWRFAARIRDYRLFAVEGVGPRARTGGASVRG